MLTIAFLDIYSSLPFFLHIYTFFCMNKTWKNKKKNKKNEETENRRFPRFSLGGRCFYCCLTSFRSASKTAVSFSSLGASLRFHATMNRVVAAVGA